MPLKFLVKGLRAPGRALGKAARKTVGSDLWAEPWMNSMERILKERGGGSGKRIIAKAADANIQRRKDIAWAESQIKDEIKSAYGIKRFTRPVRREIDEIFTLQQRAERNGKADTYHMNYNQAKIFDKWKNISRVIGDKAEQAGVMPTRKVRKWMGKYKDDLIGGRAKFKQGGVWADGIITRIGEKDGKFSIDVSYTSKKNKTVTKTLRTGKEIQFRSLLHEMTPRALSLDKIKKLVGRMQKERAGEGYSNQSKALLQEMVDNGHGKDWEDAYQYLKKQADSSRHSAVKHEVVEFARNSALLPEDVYETSFTKVAQGHIEGNFSRIAFAKEFGTNYEIVRDLFNQIDTLEDPVHFERFRMLHEGMVLDHFTRSARGLSNLEGATSVSLYLGAGLNTGIINLSQTIPNLTAFGGRAISKAAGKLISSTLRRWGDDVIKDLRGRGLTSNSIMELHGMYKPTSAGDTIAQRIARAVTKLSGIEDVDFASRALGSTASPIALADIIASRGWKAFNGSAKDMQWLKNNLPEIFDIQDFEIEGMLADTFKGVAANAKGKVDVKAINIPEKFIDRAIYAGNRWNVVMDPMHKPIAHEISAGGRSLLRFMSFSIGQNDGLRRTLDMAEKGNYKPLARFLASTPVLGVGISELRNWAYQKYTGHERAPMSDKFTDFANYIGIVSDPRATNEERAFALEHMGKYLLERSAESGALGLYGIPLNAWRRGTEWGDNRRGFAESTGNYIAGDVNPVFMDMAGAMWELGWGMAEYVGALIAAGVDEDVVSEAFLRDPGETDKYDESGVNRGLDRMQRALDKFPTLRALSSAIKSRSGDTPTDKDFLRTVSKPGLVAYRYYVSRLDAQEYKSRGWKRPRLGWEQGKYEKEDMYLARKGRQKRDLAVEMDALGREMLDGTIDEESFMIFMNEAIMENIGVHNPAKVKTPKLKAGTQQKIGSLGDNSPVIGPKVKGKWDDWRY